MSKYKAYSEYKDSGVEWLGAVPTDWLITELKRYCWVKGGYAFPSESFTSFGEPVIRIGDISQDGSINLANCKYVSHAVANQSQSYIVQNGELLMAMTGATIGKAGFYEYEFPSLINQRVGVFKVLDKLLHYRFLWYILKSNGYQEYIKLTAFGGAQPNISDAGMVGYKTTFPSLNEQSCIADFLDHETAKIDSLIEKQQQLIELLKEKRQAVISHAVTKGLTPDVPMKDSGVEWLGEVPAHWSVKRLKHISPKVGVGLVINPSTYTRDEGVYFIFGGDVKEYGFDLSKTRRISPKDSNNLLPSRLNDQDLVSVRVGYPGITAVVTKDLEGSNCASIIIIRKGMFNSEWLCAAMNIWVGRQQVDLVAYGAAQKQFNVADAVEFIFPVPPYDEQVKIAHFVKNALDKFDALSSKAQAQITLLQERRTALISAAVTGKIDVRDWVAPDSSNIEAPQEATA